MEIDLTVSTRSCARHVTVSARSCARHVIVHEGVVCGEDGGGDCCLVMRVMVKYDRY